MWHDYLGRQTSPNWSAPLLLSRPGSPKTDIFQRKHLSSIISGHNKNDLRWHWNREIQSALSEKWFFFLNRLNFCTFIMTDGGSSSSSAQDVDRMNSTSFPQTFQCWRRPGEITFCFTPFLSFFLSMFFFFFLPNVDQEWPSLLCNLEKTFKTWLHSLSANCRQGHKCSRRVTRPVYGVSCCRASLWGVQDLSHTDRQEFWQSVSHTAEMWKRIQQSITTLKKK